MGYVIAAYGLSFAVVLLYLGHLVRERRRLGRELAAGARRPGSADVHRDRLRARNSG